MKLRELWPGSVVKNWLCNLKPKRNTEMAYLQALLAYTEYHDLTPNELPTKRIRKKSTISE